MRLVNSRQVIVAGGLFVKKLFGFLVGAVLLATVGCTRSTESEKATGDIKVQIPVRENDQPTLKIVTLRKMEDLRRVSGGIATFYYAPKIDGSLVIGEVPHARFIKTFDEVFIPVDSQSADMAAVYYHLQNLTDLDASLGLARFNEGPRKVALSTRILKSDDWVRNNSFYDQNSDAIIFVDFQSQALPLTLNSGVVAHEHFHSLFSKLVNLPLIKAGKVADSLKVSSANDELRRDFEDFVLFKSLNEGLADYWGWVYSRDEKFVSASIPTEQSRSLEKPSQESVEASFRSPEDRQAELDSFFEPYLQSENKEKALETIQDIGGRYAYAMGNVYARFFRALNKTADGKDLDANAQMALTQQIIGLLEDLRESFLKNKNHSAIQPENVLELFRVKNPELIRVHCKEFERLINHKSTCTGRPK